MSVVELDAVAPFAGTALSPDEIPRMVRMGERRRRSYIGARLACKFLSRSLAGGDRETPAHSISTVTPGGARPRCPLPDGSEPFRCSVSHDDRFAVAAADEGPIGIDVELLSDRILRLVPRFAGAEERRYVEAFPGGAVQAATRLWSVKEAAAKALDIRLPESWRGVRVTALGEHASEALFGGKRLHVYHGALDGHLLTLLKA
jgi:phosphopantetheinyl transferase